MKTKICVIIIFLLFGTYTTHAQMMENSVWTEYRINIEWSPRIVSKRQYWIAGDTIISGQTYKKIVENEDAGHNGPNGYVGAIREDNGKIYARLWYWEMACGWEKESLLYDFTVQVGDIVTSTAPEGQLSYPLTVTQIDEITLETGEKRKRFFFDRAGPWIEGIGSLLGLFNEAMWHMTDYTTKRLVCFKQGDEILYQNEDWCQSNDCCADLSVSIKNPLSNIKTIVYRDDNQIIINFPEAFSGETTIQLFDATGRIVFAKTTLQNSFELNTSNYPQGIYLISIRNGNNVEYSKLIK